jgi:hypothetical protein
MKAFDKLRQLFGEPPSIYTTSLVEFFPINTKKVARDMDLVAKSEQRGKRDEPSSNATTLDDIESSIVLFVNEERSRATSSFHSQIATYDQRIASLKLEQYAGEVTAAVREAVGEFSAKVSLGRDDLTVSRRGVVEQQNYLEFFRTESKLRRPAEYPSSKLWRWSLIVLMVLVESILNGYFFGKASDFGLLGGVLQAVIVSLVNVMLALIFSRTLLRWIWHVSPFWKALGTVSLFLYIPATITFNLFVAHYREALGGDAADQAAKIAVQTFANYPLLLQDFDSWMLVIIGIAFATVAAIDGYTMDDRYPNYGNVDRAYRAAVEHYTDIKSELLDELRETRDTASSEIKELKNNLTKRRGEHDAILADRRRLVEGYKSHLDHLEIVARSLLAEYRSENRRHRSTPQPSHFDETWSMSRPKEPPEPRLPKEEVLDKLISDAENAAGTAVEKLHSEFEDAVAQYDKIETLKFEVDGK